MEYACSRANSRAFPPKRRKRVWVGHRNLLQAQEYEAPGRATCQQQKVGIAMEVLSLESSAERLNHKPLEAYLQQLFNGLKSVNGTYSIPADSGRKTAMARLFAYFFLRNPLVVIYISGWGVWGSAENLDLFYGYRKSLGVTQTLMDAPVHLFKSDEADAFVSILSMALYFLWDVWVFDANSRTVLRLSHDEWLEIRTDDAVLEQELSPELEGYMTLLSKH